MAAGEREPGAGRLLGTDDDARRRRAGAATMAALAIVGALLTLGGILDRKSVV